MSGATGPIVPLSEMSSEDLRMARLMALVEEAAEAAKEAQAIYLSLPRPPVEVIDHKNHLVELDTAIRTMAKFEPARALLDTPPLSAVPGPPRHRAPSRSDSPLLGAIDGGKPRRRGGRHAAGARTEGTVTWLPVAADPPAG